MTEWDINFCRNLRHLRQVYDMNQKEMARILGISVSTYGKMERLEESVRIHCGMVCRVCDHFQISVDEIMNENWAGDAGK